MSTIVTFYSYKGGVGRSMALANIAVLMANRGLKTLAVDWDLEAPGLERYFSYFEQSPKPGGLLPLLTEVSTELRNGRIPPSFQEHVWTINVDGNHSFDLLPSGRTTHTLYAKMLEEFDWHEFFSQGGGDFIEGLRQEWLSSYDIVLIDSRTGMSDTGGICTIQIPDVLVAMFTSNDQSTLGVLDIIDAAQKGRQKLAYDRMRLTVLPVLCRFPTGTEIQESSIWLDRLADQFSGVCDDWLLPWVPTHSMFERLKIPQTDWFGFGERLAVVEHGTSDPSGIGYALDRITDLLASDFVELEEALGSVARRPPEWQRPEREERISHEDYDYDLFVSYQHGGVLDEWVRDFVANLSDWLSSELVQTPRIFLDTNEVSFGEQIAVQVDHALNRSKLLLVILTPAYFASEYRAREWMTFEGRERITNSGPLILPILIRGESSLPARVRNRHWLDATNISLVSSQSRAPSKDNYSLLQEAANSISKMLENVGSFNPDLEIVIDEKELTEFRIT